MFTKGVNRYASYTNINIVRDGDTIQVTVKTNYFVVDKIYSIHKNKEVV